MAALPIMRDASIADILGASFTIIAATILRRIECKKEMMGERKKRRIWIKIN